MIPKPRGYIRAGLFPTLAVLCLWMPAVSSIFQSVSAAETAANGTLVEVGKKMYREGLLPSGEPMRATVQGDVPLVHAQIACVTCHRRSGLSATEGQTLVPAVSGAWLYKPLEIGRKDLYATRAQGPGTRPAYTDQTLARAIRDGIDAGGRPMDPLMPRYALGDQDLEPLLAYLKSLSLAPSPGVTETTIHFATVIAAGVDSVRRKALLDVLEAYFRDKNADTRYETRRAVSPAMHMEWEYQAYRKWDLHVWDLTGPAETWHAQLDEYYRRQPVFAVISGVGEGAWQPVHEFCEQAEVPCVLPNTDLPVVSETGFYSIYFSRGLVLEAEALAKHVLESASTGRILQVFRGDETGAAPADAFRTALRLRDAARLADLRIAPGTRLTAPFWADLMKTRPSVLVLWLGEADLREVQAIADAGLPGQIYLSSTLCQDPAQVIPPDLQGALRLVYPYALSDAWARSLSRVQPWMRSRQIAITDPRVQLNAYYAARLVGDALMHIRSNFSRDYFIERIEHSVDRLSASSAYPRLSLGPDQRFASKGSYIAKLSVRADEEVEPVTWIVP